MPKEAIEAFQRQSTENPADDQLWYFPTLAAAFAEVGRIDDARKIVKTLLSRSHTLDFEFCFPGFPYKTKELTDRYVNAVRETPDSGVIFWRRSSPIGCERHGPGRSWKQDVEFRGSPGEWVWPWPGDKTFEP